MQNAISIYLNFYWKTRIAYNSARCPVNGVLNWKILPNEKLKCKTAHYRTATSDSNIIYIYTIIYFFPNFFDRNTHQNTQFFRLLYLFSISIIGLLFATNTIWNYVNNSCRILNLMNSKWIRVHRILSSYQSYKLHIFCYKALFI